jgi:hypothetical protein
VAQSQEGAAVAKADGGLVVTGDDNRNQLAFGQDRIPILFPNME